MKNEDLNHTDPIGKWIHEAGTESLKADFHLSVLKKIESLPKTSSIYQPVISPFAWKLILIFITGIFGGSLVFLPSNQNDISLFDKLPPVKLPSPSFSLYNFSLPTIDFSQQFSLGIIAFFILGFIMIVGTIRNKQAGI